MLRVIELFLAQEKGEESSGLEALLANEGEAILLSSFIHEREKRSEMLKLLDDVTLPKYLALPTDQRQLIEELRAQDSRYLEGDFTVKPQISLKKAQRKYLKETVGVYRQVNTHRAVVRLVEEYVKHLPTGKMGPVPLTAWFTSYDPATGENIKPMHDRRIISKGTAPGAKYCQQYRLLNPGGSFEEWVHGLLPEKMQERLSETPYFSSLRKRGIEPIVESFIKNNLVGKNGPVALTTWFTSYDPVSAKHCKPFIDGKVKREGATPGHKYYSQYLNARTGGSFDEWVESQLSAEVLERLRRTPYFVQEKMTVEQIVEQYITLNPATRRGPLVLSSWFRQYDARTGENLLPQDERRGERNGTPQGHRYYQQHIALKGEQSFDEWIQEQISEELWQRLQQMPYFIELKVNIEQVVEAYIKHNPAQKRGPVPLTAWFNTYDIVTATRTRSQHSGPPKEKKIATGSKFYYRFLQSERQVSFDDWVLAQLSSEMQTRLKEMPYFKSKGDSS